MKKLMVIGIVYTPDEDAVILLKKNKPDKFKGLYIGPGGKIEPGETPYKAMVREFEEETGILLLDWELTTKYITSNKVIYVFRSECEGSIPDVGINSIEPVNWFNINNFSRKLLTPYMSVLLELAKNRYKMNWPHTFTFIG